MLFVTIAFAMFGLIIGSFLNVLVLRKGVESLSGRSHCASCGRTLTALDLVPVFSWLFLRGRCKHCGSSISWQYPLVEALTALLFALVGAALFPGFLTSPILLLRLIASLVCISLLIAIAVYDMRHTIIPDEWAYGFAGIAFLLSFSLYPSLGVVLAGPMAALPLFALWLFSGGKWMGLGDAKLALGIGWILLQPFGIISIFFSFILGSIVLVPILAAQSIVSHIRVGANSGRRLTPLENPSNLENVNQGLLRRYTQKLRSFTMGNSLTGLTMKSEVPFGPFLIASCLIFWYIQLYGVNIPLYIFGL